MINAGNLNLLLLEGRLKSVIVQNSSLLMKVATNIHFMLMMKMLQHLKYAEESKNNGDYYLMNKTVEITVNGKPFPVSAEPDVHYSAEK